MGGRFCTPDQLYKKFSENDVFPSLKLNEDQKKKVFAANWSQFFLKSGEDQKKKKKGLCRNLRQFSAGNL